MFDVPIPDIFVVGFLLNGLNVKSICPSQKICNQTVLWWLWCILNFKFFLKNNYFTKRNNDWLCFVVKVKWKTVIRMSRRFSCTFFLSIAHMTRTKFSNNCNKKDKFWAEELPLRVYFLVYTKVNTEENVPWKLDGKFCWYFR